MNIYWKELKTLLQNEKLFVISPFVKMIFTVASRGKGFKIWYNINDKVTLGHVPVKSSCRVVARVRASFCTSHVGVSSYIMWAAGSIQKQLPLTIDIFFYALLHLISLSMQTGKSL